MVPTALRMPLTAVVGCVMAFVSIQTSLGQDLPPTPVPRPPVDYAMAAPRAAIVAPLRNIDLRMANYGAAFNFPRRNGSLTIPIGTTVLFRDSRNLEGVWFERTFGHLATCLQLQIWDPTSRTERWITLGVDGARATRPGPSLGTANVMVPHRFLWPGTYALRAIIRTLAVPMDPNIDPATAVVRNPFAAKAENTVYVKVRVVDGPADVVADTPAPEEEVVLPLEPEAQPATGDPVAGAEALFRLDYVMAAPRAALVPLPRPTDVPLPPYGAAFNFARRPGSLIVPAGAVVVFRESRNMEGVWYPHVGGLLGTSFELQMLDPATTEERWIPIGRDGAKAIRKGPSIGMADVKVPHRFERPGSYVLRAIIHTNAVPMEPNLDPAAVPNPIGISAHAENIVCVKVEVVESPILELTAADDPAAEDAEAMEQDGGVGMLAMADAAELAPPVPPTGDLDDDGDVDGFDFLTFSNRFDVPPSGESKACDFDGDGDVDGFDFLTFANCFNGADRIPQFPR